MRERKANLFKVAEEYKAICITTNGFVKSDGSAVMEEE